MKTKFTLLALFVAALFSVNAQQAPNSGFNDWNDSPLAPDSWTTIESLFGGQVTGLAFRDTLDKVEGSASIRLLTDSIQAGPNKLLLAGVVSLGTGSYSPPPTGISFNGIPFPYRPDTIWFAYKYTTPATDTAAMQIVLSNSGTPVLGGAVPLDPTPQWQLTYVELTPVYLNSTTPDTLLLQFTSSAGNSAVQGSVLRVDAIRFGYIQLPNSLQEVVDRLNISVYPNPATEAITVSTDEDVTGYSVLICDLNGRTVSVTTLTGQYNRINVADLANGTYIYRVADKTGNVLKNDRFNVVR